MNRLLDVRKLALVSCAAEALGSLYPAWDATKSMFMLAGNGGGSWLLAILLFAVALFLMTLPLVFLFFLHRNRAQLRVSTALRRLALVAAIGLAGIEIAGSVAWIRSSSPYFDSMAMVMWGSGGSAVREAQSDPRRPYFLSAVLSLVFYVSLVLILVAFFQGREDQATPETPASMAFRKVTRVALVTGYVLLGFGLLRIAYIPGIIWSVRSIGRTPPTVMDLLPGMATGLLLTACLVSIPFIVSRSLPAEPTEEFMDTDESLPGPEVTGLGDDG